MRRQGRTGGRAVIRSRSRLAGHKLELFTATGRASSKRHDRHAQPDAREAHQGGGEQLDEALHQKALSAGQAIGSFTVKVSNTPIAGPRAGPAGGGAGTGRPGSRRNVHLRRGTVTVAGATLNTILGQNVLTTGEPVGGISVILPAAAAGS